MTGIDRRTLLRGLLAGGAAALAGALGWALPRPRAARPALRASARESARVVGRAFLERFPEEADAAALRRALAGGPLAPRVRRDFERGDVVQLHGWVLSRTEARRCALEALA